MSTSPPVEYARIDALTRIEQQRRLTGRERWELILAMGGSLATSAVRLDNDSRGSLAMPLVFL